MTDITTNDFLNSLTFESRQKEAAQRAEEEGDDGLGQTAFLELMITQLENQDPLSPQENGDFIAQLAQFSSVEQLGNLNDTFGNFTASFLSNQALEASSLVGRFVTVPTENATLGQNSFVGGVVTLPATTSDMKLNIYNEGGELEQEIPLGQHAAGDVVFRWDGNLLEVNGELLDWEAEAAATPGDYRFEVTASIDGKAEQIDTALTANVNSVTVGTDKQLTLNLSGIGPVSINDVKQFN